ncbi:hypothetical protein LCGC14_0860380 [marine sediment metagenome]|uniref:Uncharacterized protein n=1 Tax=marine sediment metagenome TaxID=412755 RepID=A0A0F9P7K5_9ZZZZ
MSTSLRKYRQDVGRELGLVKYGTATSVTTTTVLDTSDDSWMDPADDAARYNEAGVLVDDGTDLHFRQNVVYAPATQKLTVGTISGLSGTPYYEIHTEPLLHALNHWPYLINEGLQRIRKISLQPLLMNGRGYYDLTDWTDVSAVSHFRRLYNVGANLCRNADFSQWATGDNGPADWTVSAALDRIVPVNYAHAVQLDAGESIYQDIGVGAGSKRLKVSMWTKAFNGATGTMTIAAYLSDGTTVERSTTATIDGSAAATANTLITAELELTNRTNKVRVTFAAAAADCNMWSPMAWVMSIGRHQRIVPISALQADRTVRLWTPKRVCVGELALLLPENQFTVGTTNALDVATVNAPYELAKASIIVQVLRFLVQHPEIPKASKSEYLGTLSVWQTTFNHRIREHHRKLAKSSSVWERGELN